MFPFPALLAFAAGNATRQHATNWVTEADTEREGTGETPFPILGTPGGELLATPTKQTKLENREKKMNTKYR